MKQRKNTMTYVIAVISMIISFVLIILAKGLENYTIDGTFELTKIFNESIRSVTFWILNVTIAISVAMFWFWSLTLKKTKLLGSEEWSDKVESYNNCVKFKKKDFVQFIKEENQRRRIAAYVEHIETKIIRLEKKYSRVTWIGMKLKRDIHLENRIKRLQVKITQEYLDNHLVWWWYNAVSPSDFRYNTIYADDVSDRTSSKEGSKIVRTMSKKIVLSLVTSAFALSFLTSLLLEFKLSISFWIVLLTVLMTLMINFWMGMQFGERIYETEYVAVIDNRIRVLKDYITWSKEHNGQEETYADKVIKSYEDNLKLKEQLDSAIKQAESIGGKK